MEVFYIVLFDLGYFEWGAVWDQVFWFCAFLFFFYLKCRVELLHKKPSGWRCMSMFWMCTNRVGLSFLIDKSTILVWLLKHTSVLLSTVTGVLFTADEGIIYSGQLAASSCSFKYTVIGNDAICITWHCCCFQNLSDRLPSLFSPASFHLARSLRFPPFPMPIKLLHFKKMHTMHHKPVRELKFSKYVLLHEEPWKLTLMILLGTF